MTATSEVDPAAEIGFACDAIREAQTTVHRGRKLADPSERRAEIARAAILTSRIANALSRQAERLRQESRR
jgi:hypothetical protein